jgi:hypothetical protein
LLAAAKYIFFLESGRSLKANRKRGVKRRNENYIFYGAKYPYRGSKKFQKKRPEIMDACMCVYGI